MKTIRQISDRKLNKLVKRMGSRGPFDRRNKYGLILRVMIETTRRLRELTSR